MPIIPPNQQRQIQDHLKALVNPVKIVYFTQELECDSCRETGQLLQEFSALSDKLSLQVFNFQVDREEVAKFGVDKIPATIVMGDRDYGIRFYGIPLGYEFASVMEAVAAVSERESGLQAATKEKLRAITTPVHLQVLVTPT